MVGTLRTIDAGLPGPARGLFTTRVGGSLALRADDGSRALPGRDALARAAHLAAGDLAFAEQVHGAGVATLARPLSDGTRRAGARGADALVTRSAGMGLGTLAADCAPVLLADPVAGVVAAAHCGRPGLVAGVLPATVAAMVAAGADPAETTAVVGPCIGGCCYELPAELADAVGEAAPRSRSTTRAGTPSIDLRSGAEAQLRAVGVAVVGHVGGCTYEQPELLFSHRRDGTAERHGGLVWLP